VVGNLRNTLTESETHAVHMVGKANSSRRRSSLCSSRRSYSVFRYEEARTGEWSDYGPRTLLLICAYCTLMARRFSRSLASENKPDFCMMIASRCCVVDLGGNPFSQIATSRNKGILTSNNHDWHYPLNNGDALDDFEYVVCLIGSPPECFDRV